MERLQRILNQLQTPNDCCNSKNVLRKKGITCSPEVLKSIAECLLGSWSSDRVHRPFLEINDSFWKLQTLDDALEVHRYMIDSTQEKRLGFAGYKLGWKNNYAEKHALHGPIFSSGLFGNKDGVSLSTHKIFAAEAEFGFVIGQVIKPRSTVYEECEVWDMVSHTELCIELCGTRHVKSKERLHYVADALLAGCVIRGPNIGKPNPSTLPKLKVRMSINGKECCVGDATNNPRDSPLGSLTYLINDLCVKRNVSIPADVLVICGHTCALNFAARPCPPHTIANEPTVKWKSGDTLVAEFETLGSVSVSLFD